jgi:hypothetical protein
MNVARAMVAKMRQGSVRHFTEVADRFEGKVTHTVVGSFSLDVLAERIAEIRKSELK